MWAHLKRHLSQSIPKSFAISVFWCHPLFENLYVSNWLLTTFIDLHHLPLTCLAGLLFRLRKATQDTLSETASNSICRSHVHHTRLAALGNKTPSNKYQRYWPEQATLGGMNLAICYLAKFCKLKIVKANNKSSDWFLQSELIHEDSLHVLEQCLVLDNLLCHHRPGVSIKHVGKFEVAEARARTVQHMPLWWWQATVALVWVRNFQPSL